MSVAALLGHFGIEVPRYVTMAGQIVFDGVTPTADGRFSHSSHGLVAPVANHTFHGGEEEPDDGVTGPDQWWDDQVELARHVNAMKRDFPLFTFVPAEPDLGPCWIGDLNTGRGAFKVGIVLRRDKGLPSVSVIGGPRLGAQAGRRWTRAPHLYDGGNLCVADRDDWLPEEHTAATVAAWAAHWLAAFTEWRITRRWPVEGCGPRVA